MDDIELLPDEYRPSTHVQLVQAAKKEPSDDIPSLRNEYPSHQEMAPLLQSQLIGVRSRFVGWGGYLLWS